MDSPEVLDAAQVEAAVILQENQGRWNDIQVDWDDAKREAEQAGKDKKEAERIEQDRAAREAFQKERAGIQVREEAFNRRRHEKIQKELRRTEQEAKRKQVGPIARTGTEGVRELETEEGTIERTPEEVEASGRLLEWDDEPIEPGEAPEPTAEEQRDLELDDALDDASERVEAAKKADDPIAVLRAVDTYERTKVELQAPAEAPKTPEGGIDYGELARRHGERRKEAGPKKVWD